MKIIKYFFEFISIISLFCIFKIIGLRNASGLGSILGKLIGPLFRPKNIIIDQDFYENNNREQVMERAQKAKYEQDELSKKVLLATKNAKLVHYTASRKPKDQRPPPVIFYDTMRIRNKLQNL